MKMHLNYLVILGMALALMTSALLTACGGDDDDDDNDDDAADDDDNDDDNDDDTADDDTADDDTADDDTADDDTADDDNDDDTLDSFWTENFDAMDAGALPAPWVVDATNATIEVVALKAGSGNVMRITDASTADGDGCSALIDLSANTELASAFSLNYDMRMTAGNSIGFSGMQFDDPYYYEEFYIDYESGKLTSLGGAGDYMDCVTFDESAWHTITVQVDPVGHTYSVFADGVATACADLDFIYGDAPFAGFKWVGYNGDTWSGTGDVDNLVAYLPPAK
jgi:hypothetical protein